jgi:uncharacterized membrane protein YfcA
VLWLSLLFGSLVSDSLALTGGGGALFAVPMLVYGMGMPVREAVSVTALLKKGRSRCSLSERCM